MKINLILIYYLLTTLISSAQTFEKPLLVDFSPSECDEGADVYRLRTRIIDKWIIGDTLLVEVGTKATCCVEFIPSIEFNNDTLNLSFEETGSPCECMCCYQFIYHIVGLKDIDVPIKLQNNSIELSNEKYFTYPIKYEMLDGDTINYIDKYGLKQGYWYNRNDTTGNYFRGFAKDDEFEYREVISYDSLSKAEYININRYYKASIYTKYNENELIERSVTTNNDYYQTIDFYPDGKLKKITISGADDLWIWKEYYPNGKLYKERFSKNEKSLWSIYYYDTGELMARFYVYKKSDFSSPIHKWECYDRKGKKIEKDILVESGLIER